MTVVMVQVMARRMSMSLRPVHRIKHVVDTQGGLSLGATVNIDLIDTKDAPVLANTDEVETGSKVNGIFLSVEVNATSSAALPNVYMIVYKNPGGNLATPLPNTIGSNDNKRFVIHQEMVMLQGQTGSNPRTLFKGVIVIPRGYKRNGPNDRLILVLQSPGVNIQFCVQCHYKEFR